MADEATFAPEEVALVCRWRLAGRQVPLLNRHMRALGQRTIAGEPLRPGLLSWVKQHIEWSLADDTTVEVPQDGVLMLVVDTQGRAVMSVGAYEPLPDRSAAVLAARACDARREAAATGVAPETLCAVSAYELVLGAPADAPLSGAATFARQLAETRGCTVRFDESLADRVTTGALIQEEAGAALMLVSDEHGAVRAASPAEHNSSKVPAAAATATTDEPLDALIVRAFDTLRARAAHGGR